MCNNVQHTTVADAKPLLSVSLCYCTRLMNSENTNIATTSNIIHLEKVVRVQLDRDGELWRCLKSQINLRTLCCPYMDTD